MKKTVILIIGIAMISLISCQGEKIDSKQSETETIKSEIKIEPNKKVFDNLDAILSPFEDMTEYALNKNEKGIKKTLKEILSAKEKIFFEQNLSTESMQILKSKIEDLQKLVIDKNYNSIALLSTEIFDFNTKNFLDANKIENQIKIEHLDYLGFKILALLNQDKVDWEELELTISNGQQKWSLLSKNVSNINLKDSFDYLFDGLLLSAKNKDSKMLTILASMDLSLVDVLENNI